MYIRNYGAFEADSIAPMHSATHHDALTEAGGTSA